MQFQASVPAPHMPTIHKCQPALWTVGLDEVPLATPASERRSLRRALRGRSRLDTHYIAPQFHLDYNTEQARTVTPQPQRQVTHIPSVLVRSLLCLLLCIASYSFVPAIYTGTVEVSFAECFTRWSWYDPDGFTHIVHFLTCILPHLWAAVPCYFIAATSWANVHHVSWLVIKISTWCVLCYHTDNAHEFAGVCSSDNMRTFAAKATSTLRRKPPPTPTDSSLYADSDYEFIIMDSGCTTPILNDPKLFWSLKPSNATVCTADKTKITMQQEGPAPDPPNML